jgi:urea transport system substrate-binding protein
MKRRNFLTTSATLAAAGFLTRLGFVDQAHAEGPLKVGVLVPMSGPAGLFGPSSKNCAQMAVDKINAEGGIFGRMIEPIYTDVGVPPAEAAQAVLKVWKRQGAEAFIGMNDSAVRGAVVNLFKGQVPYIYTPVYEGGACAPGLFVIGETPAQQLQPVIPWLAANKHAKKWYLIGNDYNWPRDTNAAAKTYIAASGGEVVGEEYLPFTADNFDSNLAKIKESGANAVLITLVGGASVGFNRAFGSFGLSDHVIRLGTLIEENTLAGIGADGSRNLFASAGYFSSVATPAAKAFAEAYGTKFGSDAPVLNTLGESCYDGLLLLSALAKKAGSLSVADMEAAANGTSYEGPRGKATMEKRHVSADIFLAEAKGAAFKIVETFKNVSPGSTCA